MASGAATAARDTCKDATNSDGVIYAAPAAEVSEGVCDLNARSSAHFCTGTA